MANKLEVVAGLQDKEFQAGIGRMQDGLNRLKGTVDGAGSGFGKLGTAFKGFAVGAAAAGVAALTTAVAGLTYTFKNSVKEIVEVSDAYDDFGRLVGLSASQVSEFAAAGRLAGVEFSSIQSSFLAFSKSVEKSSLGVKKYEDSFAKLGVSIKDAGGTIKPTSRLFLESAEQLSKMTDGAEKTAIAMRLFGSQWKNIEPLFENGISTLEGFILTASKLGTTLDDSTTKAATSIDASMKVINEAWTGFRYALVKEALPAIADLTERFAAWLVQSEAGKRAGEALGKTFAEMAKYIASVDWEGVVNDTLAFGKAVAELGQSIAGAVGFIMDVSRAIQDFVDTINSFTGVPVGFSDLTTTFRNTAHEIDLLVNGFSQVGTFLSDIFSQLGAAAQEGSGAFSDAWSTMSSNFMTAVEPIIAWFQEFGTVVTDAVASIDPTAIWNFLVTSFEATRQQLIEAVSLAFSELGTVINNILSTIDVATGFSTAVEPLVAAAQDIVTRVGEAFSGLVGVITQAFSGLSGAISSAIDSVKAVIGEWVSWLGQKAQEAAAYLSSLTGASQGGFKSNYLEGQRGGPRSLASSFALTPTPFAANDNTGSTGGFALADIIAAAKASLDSYVSSAAAAASASTTLANATTSVQQGMGKVAQATTAAAQTAQQAQSSFAQLGQQIVGAIGNSIGSFLDAVINKTKSVKQAFKDMVKDILSQLAKLAVNWIFNSLFGGAGGGGFGGGLFSLSRSVKQLRGAADEMSYAYGRVRSPSMAGFMNAANENESKPMSVVVNNLSDQNIDINVYRERDELVIEAAINRMTRQAAQGGYSLTDTLERTYGLQRVR